MSIQGDYLTQSIILQRKILEEVGERDPLFPLLQSLSEERDSFPFPESLLCISSLSTLVREALTPKHSLFSRINSLIDTIEKKKGSYPQEMEETLQKVQMAYRSYITQICQARTIKEKKRLLKGPCRLYGVFHQKLECRHLTQKGGRFLTCLSKNNQDEKSNPYGLSIVRKKGSIFYKRAYVNPLEPGMEYAVDALNRLIAQGGSPPTELLKIDNLCVNEGRERVFHFLQVSHEISGTNLLEFLESPQRLNKSHFTSMVILALITVPNDGKADNYMACPNHDGTYSIIGIDNDASFYPPLRKIPSGEFFVQLRTVLFLLPEMREEVDQTFIQEFLHLEGEKVLINWLKDLKDQNKRYQALLSTSGFSKQDFETLSLPIQLRRESIIQAYHALVSLQAFLRENPHRTHFEMFTRLFPEIAKAYHTLLEETGHDPLEAQKKLFTQGISIEENRSDIFYETPQGIARQSIDDCIEALVKAIFPSLTSSQQEKFLNALFLSFQNLSCLELSNVKIKGGTLCHLLAHCPHLTKLILKGGEGLTGPTLYRLLNDFPHLQLHLSSQNLLSSEEWKELLTFSWKQERTLTLHIQEESYLAYKENRSLVLEKALDASCFSLAEALLALEGALPAYPLHRYARLGNLSTMRFLLEKGSSIEEEDDQQRTPLHLAILHKQEEVATFLIEEGSPLDKIDSQGWTPLHGAACHNLNRIALHLIRKGATIPSTGNTPLHIAALHGSLETLQVFQKENPSLFTTLLETANPEGDTALHKATQNPHPEKEMFSKKDLVSFLIDQKANVHATNLHGYTPLHYAAKYGDTQALKCLAQHGGNLEAQGEYGRTLLHMSVFNGHLLVTLFLIEQGCNPNQRADFGKTPLHEAVFRHDLNAALALCSMETLDVKIGDRNGNSPLWYAMTEEGSLLHVLLHHRSFKSLSEEKMATYLTPMIEEAEGEKNKTLFKQLKLFEITKKVDSYKTQKEITKDKVIDYHDQLIKELEDHWLMKQ